MKTTVALVYILLLFNSCKMKDEHKYSWAPAVTALENYPMEVYSGHLITGDNLKGAYGYLPFNKTIDYGLDQSEETNDNLFYPPRYLDVTWYSFTEKKTYSGIFELDYQLIDKTLQKQSLGQPFYDTKEKKLLVAIENLALIKVGLLPGGVVRLWVSTQRGDYEVGRYQGKEDKTIDWKDVYPDFSMVEVAEDYNKDLSQEIQDQIAQNRIPFGSWERLFNKHEITLKTKASDKIENIRIEYTNAEKEAIYYNGGGVVEDKKRAAPLKIYLEWRREDGVRVEVETIFDQEKILNLYKTINPNEKLDFVFNVDKTAALNSEGKGLIMSLENLEKKIDLTTCIKKQRTYKAYFQYPDVPPTFKTVPVYKE